MKTEQIKRGFNFIAPYYDFCIGLIFGKTFLNAQTRYIRTVSKARSILIFGGGTGKILSAVAKSIKFQSLTYIDISQNMIGRAIKHCVSSGINVEDNIEFIEGSTEVLHENKRYDLIITPFVLDCFSDEHLQQVMDKLDEHLVPGGKWLFTDFNESENTEFIWALHHGIIKSLYLLFNFFCRLGITQLPDFEKSFDRLNYTMLDESLLLNGLVVSRVYQKPIEGKY